MTDIIQRSFEVGEVSEDYWLRNDLEWFNKSVRSCKNFIPTAGGTLINRGGTKFIRTMAFKPSFITTFSKIGNVHYRLFAGSPNDSNYNVAILTDKVAASYNTTSRSGVAGVVRDFAQVLTGVYRENAGILAFSGVAFSGPIGAGGHRLISTYYDTALTTWTITNLRHTVYDLPPPDPVYVNLPGAGTIQVRYVITSVTDKGAESVASFVATDVGDTLSVANPATLTFTEPVYGTYLIKNYYIYRYESGSYRFVGDRAAVAASTVLTFVDFNFARNVNLAPLNFVKSLFNLTNYVTDEFVDGNTICSHKQRFVIGGNKTVTFSRTGTPQGLVYSDPLQSTDPFNIKSMDMNNILYVRSVGNKLFVFDPNSIWTISGDADGIVTPLTSGADRSWTQTIKDVMPLVYKNNVVYASGNNELFVLFKNQSGSDDYYSKNISQFGPRFLFNESISNVSYNYDISENIWCVAYGADVSRSWRSATLSEQQGVVGWSNHQMTNGNIVCGHEGVFVVERTIAGVLTYTIESLEPHVDSLTAGVYLDSYVTYASPALGAVSGLSHLNGLTVFAMVDGIKTGPFVVSAGAITLTSTGTVVNVGLPYESVVTTHDLDLVGAQTLVRQAKITSCANVYFRNTPNGEVRVNSDPWQQIKFREEEDAYVSTVLKSGLTEDIYMSTSPAREQTISVRQAEPFPMTIVAIARSVKEK